MAEIFAGCTLDRLPHPKGAKQLPFFEYAPKGPLPSLATLARAAKQLPQNRARALVCPRSTWTTPKGALRPGPELEAGLDWITRVADILSARAIVLATGSELSTGERDRSLLAQFIERLRPTGRLLVVAPRGLWEAEHGEAFARQANCIYGFDPLEDDAPSGPVVYARVRPMGARPRLTEGHLAQIAERMVAAQAETLFAAIESEQAVRDAKRLEKALREFESSYDPTLEQDESLEDEDEDEDEDEELEDDEEEDEASDEDLGDEDQASDDGDEELEDDEED